MDGLDMKILQVLDWNGRAPVNHIAKKVKASKDVVNYRIKKLEKRVITRYFPIIDMQKLGYHTSRIYFDLEEINKEEEEDFVDFLDKEINAGLIFRMDYPYRYGVFLWVKSVYEVEHIIKTIKRKLGKALLRYNHSIVCTYKLYPKDYLFGKDYHKDKATLCPGEKEKYDKNDIRILEELAENARKTTVEISQRLKMPQTTVSRKIRELEKKKIILGYRAEINYSALGYMNYFLEIYLDSNNNLKEIEGWADQHRNVVWLQKVVGTCDIEIEVELKDRSELEIFLNGLRKRFKNIRKIVFWSQQYKKLTFLPKA